jgi:hypothetical protein
MSNTIGENYSLSPSTFGLEGGLANLPSNDVSDNSIRVVDLYSPKQPTVDLPAPVEANPSTFSDISVSTLQQAVTGFFNLDTKQYGVVGSGAAAGVETYKGDAARDFKGLTKSVAETKDEMYAQLDVKLDGIFGKGQWEKPTGEFKHNGYVAKVAEAMKLMSPEQKEQFKNDLEKIGQPFKTNFGQSRIRTDVSTPWNVALNSYMVGAFTSEQAIEQTEMIKSFHKGREAAQGRTPKK